MLLRLVMGEPTSGAPRCKLDHSLCRERERKRKGKQASRAVHLGRERENWIREKGQREWEKNTCWAYDESFVEKKGKARMIADGVTGQWRTLGI